jgi:hypothetical protein
MLYLALQWNKYPLVSKEKERKSSNDLGQEEEEEFWAATSEDPFLLKLYWHRLHSIVEQGKSDLLLYKATSLKVGHMWSKFYFILIFNKKN